MGTLYQDWDAAWAATSIAASVVANAGNATTAAISSDGKVDTEVSVECAYGATATQGLKVYVLRDVDGINYEDVNTAWGFEMSYAVSTTRRQTFTVPASISNFKIHVTNNSGADATVTVRTKQAVVTTV